MKIFMPEIPVVDVEVSKARTGEVRYPSMVAAKYCPACGRKEPRRMTKKVMPRSVRVRWMCGACSTVFDVFHGGR